MGLFSKLQAAGSLADAGQAGVLSPWADSDSLAKGLIVAEALGVELSKLPLGRDAAIQLPAVAKVRHSLVAHIAPLPLVAKRGATVLEARATPTFLYRTDAIDTPYDRMAWTVDDLLFHGRSCWAVERGAKGTGKYGPILDAVRIPIDAWRAERGRVHVDMPGMAGGLAEREDVLVFSHPSRGLLRDAAWTLRAYEAIERAYVSRAKNPIPVTVIRHTSADAVVLEQPEIDDLLGQWRVARDAPGGALGYLPPTLTLETPGADATSMLENARNAARIDIANHTNVPVTMLDGGVSQESMTYRNAGTELSRFYSETLAGWIDPIAARLSADDVVPAGQSVRFDLSRFDTPAPDATGVPVED